MNTTLTEMELKTYLALMAICKNDYSADMEQLGEATGLSEPTLKGVVGSLCKKGAAYSETGERGHDVVDIFAIDADGYVISYGEQT